MMIAIETNAFVLGGMKTKGFQTTCM